jgi:hypothetical protein
MRRFSLARHPARSSKKPSISSEFCADEHVRSRFVASAGWYLLLAVLGVADQAFATPSSAGQILFFGAASELPLAQFVVASQSSLESPREGPHQSGQSGSPGGAEGWVLADAWFPGTGVSPAELIPLRQVEDLLAAARRSAAELDESAALRSLAEAQRLAWDALSVPGAAAFCAEVELQLAVTAAQAGRWELAADSLARAARLDGPRHLLAAEASPEVVALANRVFRDAAAGAEGELPIGVDAEGARIFVDDVDRGLAPQRVRVRAGTHALRIEAPERVPYHARIEVAQGVRPPQRYVLAPDPRAVAKAQMRAALHADATTLAYATYALLSAATELSAVVWIESEPSSMRRLIHRCDASGCIEPIRIERDAARATRSETRLTAETLLAARAWLREQPVTVRVSSAEGPWWNRWYVWTALSALAIGASAAAAVALSPEPTRSLRVVVDSDDLR